MRITVVGSIAFAKQMTDICAKLKQLGHEPLMHEHMFLLGEGRAGELVEGDEENSDIKRKYDYIKWWHNCIKSSDAILVCNFDKRGIRNYIGGNTLMEMGFAHVNDKKILLLNPIPQDVPYLDEIKAMTDKVIDGDLSKVG
jgi:hypothetical protein